MAKAKNEMKKPKIVFLRGIATSGKSTAFESLKKLRKEGALKGWVLVSHPELKSWFNYLDDKRDLQKEALFSLIKQVMKTKKNIMLEEMSAKTAKKYLSSYINKYDYELTTFEFILDDIETAYARDVKRIANKDKHHKKTLGQKFIRERHLHHKMNLDKNCIFVNSSKLSKKQVVDLILKELT